ncbi:unnamed protein product [Discosporangium mesarthrocarpum]
MAKARHQRELGKKAEEDYHAERLRRRGPVGAQVKRRERERPAAQAKESNKRRADNEKALRDEEKRISLEEEQKVMMLIQVTIALLAEKKKRESKRARKRSPKLLKNSGDVGSFIEGSQAQNQEGSAVVPIGGEAVAGEHEKKMVELQGKRDQVCDEVRLGHEKFFHETELCAKRILPCELGCGLRLREEEWLSPSEVNPDIPTQQRHEESECPRRLVPCKQKCGEWLPFEERDHHMKFLCVKRPFPPIKCRLGCGETFDGGLHRMLQSEEERIEHEHELCPHRLIHCTWEGCENMVRAKDRKSHRNEHVLRTGINFYPVPGTYTYKACPSYSTLRHSTRLSCDLIRRP